MDMGWFRINRFYINIRIDEFSIDYYGLNSKKRKKSDYCSMDLDTTHL